MHFLDVLDFVLETTALESHAFYNSLEFPSPLQDLQRSSGRILLLYEKAFNQKANDLKTHCPGLTDHSGVDADKIRLKRSERLPQDEWIMKIEQPGILQKCFYVDDCVC